MHGDVVYVGARVLLTGVAWRAGRSVRGVEYCGCDVCWSTKRTHHPVPAVVTKVHKLRAGIQDSQRVSIELLGAPGRWVCYPGDLAPASIVEAIGDLDTDAAPPGIEYSGP